MRVDSSPDDKMSGAASGRRLRSRAAQITNGEDNSDEAEDNGRRRKYSGFKRKAAINVESLYLQENCKNATSTPLETIYELPRFIENGKSTVREDTQECDQSKEDIDVADLSMSVMAARKIRRFCLFPSHYFPPKQKTRFRKERARKMKQLRGVKIPKGTAISAEELEAVLACLFEDEGQNAKPIDITKRFSNITENIGFYEGNIIKPDINNEGVDDIIKNMDALRVNKSKLQKEVPSESEDTIKTHLIFDDFLSSTITDEPKQPCSPNCHEKKVRRRSGRLLACPLQSVDKTLDVPIKGMQRIAELSPLNLQNSFMTDSSGTTCLAADVKPQNVPSHELGKSPLDIGVSSDIKLVQVDTQFHNEITIKKETKNNLFVPEELWRTSVSTENLSSDIKLEQLDTKFHKAIKVKQKKESTKNLSRPEELFKSSVSVEKAFNVNTLDVDTKLRKTIKVEQKKVSIKDKERDNILYSEPSTEQRAAAKEKTKQRKPQSEQGKETKVKRLEMGIKRSSKSYVDNQMKKRRDCKNDTIELFAENVSELKSSLINIVLNSPSPNNLLDTGLLNLSESAALKPQKGCRGKGKSRSRGRRRVSGIQKPLYSTILQPASPSDSSNKSLDQLDGAVESDPCLRLNILTSTSPTVPLSGSMVGCCSPVSPSAGMAALTLNTDKPSTSSTAKICQSPISRLNRKINTKARRRSSRLSMDFAASEGIPNNSASGFGSYWSSCSPSITPVPNIYMNTLPKVDEKGNIASRPSNILNCKSPHVEKESTATFIDDKRGTHKMEIKSRRRSRMLHKVDLEMVEKTKASAKVDSSSCEIDHIAASTSSVEEFVQDNSVNIVSLRAQGPQVGNNNSVVEHNEQLLVVSSQSTRVVSPHLESLSCAATQRITVASVHDNLQRSETLASCVLPSCVDVRDLPGGDNVQAGNPRHSSVINPQGKNSNFVPATHSDSLIISIPNQSPGTQEYLATPCSSQANSDEKQCLDSSVSNIKSISSRWFLSANSTDAAWNSPIITGMFENKTGIRQGKVFCNKDAQNSSPITHF
nr:uncharacterized protein LOC123771145 [Procambarus clarkii]